MERLLLSWFRDRIESVIQDFNPDSFEQHVREGLFVLRDVRLADNVVKQIGSQLACQVPVEVESVFVEQVTLRLNFFEQIAVHVKGLTVVARTQHPSTWNVDGIRDNLRVWRQKQLDVHTELMRVDQAWSGGGVLHSMLGGILKKLDLCIEDVETILEDDFSMQIARSRSAKRPFRIGVGFQKAALLPGGKEEEAYQSTAVLKVLRVEKPFSYLDRDPAAFAEPGSATSPATAPSEYAKHAWILAPASDTQVELGVLQCRTPTPFSCGPGASAPQRGDGGCGPLATAYEFAILSRPLHGAGSIAEDKELPELYLPRSGCILCGQQLRLKITPGQVEAFAALFSSAVLGYGSVLEGIHLNSGRPSKMERTEYSVNWLSLVMDENSAGSIRQNCSSFEEVYPLDIVLRVRREALLLLPRGDSIEETEEAEQCCNVAKMPDSWFGWSWKPAASAPPGGDDLTAFGGDVRAVLQERVRSRTSSCLDEDVCGSDTSSTNMALRLFQESVVQRDPTWQDGWLHMSRAGGVGLVGGAIFQDLTVDIVVDDVRATNAAMRSLHPVNALRMTMSRARLGITGQMHSDSLMQASLVGFKVVDYYGVWKLEHFEKSRLLAVPSTLNVVESLGETNASPEESELYFAAGHWQLHEVATKPAGIIRLRSYGRLRLNLSPTQMVVLLIAVFPPQMCANIGLYVAGKPWWNHINAKARRMARNGRGEEAVRPRAHFELPQEQDLKSMDSKEIPPGAGRRPSWEWPWPNSSILESADDWNFGNDLWDLDVELAPVTVLVPVPLYSRGERTDFDEIAGDCAWDDTFTICLGRTQALGKVHACVMDEHTTGAASSSNSAGNSSMTAGSICDEYSLNVRGLSIKRVTPEDEHVVLPSSSATLCLLLGHWSRTQLPQIHLKLDAKAFDCTLSSGDVKSLVSMGVEVFWVACIAVKEQAHKSRKSVNKKMTAARASRRSLHGGPRLSSNGNDRRESFRQNADSMAHSDVGKRGTQLFHLDVNIGCLFVRVELPTPRGMSEPVLGLSITGARLHSVACVDGSGRLVCKIEDISVEASAETNHTVLYSSGRTITSYHERNLGSSEQENGGPAAYGDFGVKRGDGGSGQRSPLPKAKSPGASSQTHRSAADGEAEHLLFVVESTSPDGDDEEERILGVHFVVRRPTVHASVAALKHLLHPLAHSVNGGVNYAGSSDGSLWFDPLAIMPDRCFVLASISEAEVLLPCAGELTFIECHGDPCAPHDENLLLRARGSVNFTVTDCQITSDHVCADISDEPLLVRIADLVAKATLGASVMGLTVDFVHANCNCKRAKRLLQPVKVLEPCRLQASYTYVGARNGALGFGDDVACGAARLRVDVEPVSLWIFPPTRYLVLDLLCGLQRLANEAGDAWQNELHVANEDSYSFLHLVCDVALQQSAAFLGGVLHPLDIDVQFCLEALVIQFSGLKGRSQQLNATVLFEDVALRLLARIPTADRDPMEAELTPAEIASAGFMRNSQASRTSDIELDSALNSETSEPDVEASASIGDPVAVLGLRGRSSTAESLRELVQAAEAEAEPEAGGVPNGNSRESLPSRRSAASDQQTVTTATSVLIEAMTGPWVIDLQAYVQAEAMNALAMRMEPILEPVHICGDLPSAEYAAMCGRKKMHCGQLTLSWINVNMPVGVAYAASLWQRAAWQWKQEQESLVERNRYRDHLRWQDNARASTAHINMHLHRSEEILGCHVVNALGEPIVVKRLLPLARTGRRSLGESECQSEWLEIPATRADGDGTTTEHRASSEDNKDMMIPALMIRGHFRDDHYFEILMREPLQVFQYEITQLECPWIRIGTCSTIPIMLRAVPRPDGGCALLVCCPFVVRNNTTLPFIWKYPAPRNISEQFLQELEFSEKGPNAVPTTRMTEVAWARKEYTEDDDEASPSRAAKKKSSKDEELRLAPRHRVLLPLSWLRAAGDPLQSQRLCFRHAATSGAQVLPSLTLWRLGAFEFEKEHNAQAAKLTLPGSLVKLGSGCKEDITHVCCTVILGLACEKACCLELVVSSCALLVNHLPVPITVEPFAGGETGEAISLTAGSMGRQYFAADHLDVRFEKRIADVEIRGGDVFQAGESVEIQAYGRIREKGEKASQKRFTRRKGAGDAENISIQVQVSSAFDMDPRVNLTGALYSWCESLSYQHPPMWATYRRALTFYASRWVENHSTLNVFIRGGGGGVGASKSELEVPSGQRRLLPAYLSNEKVFRLSQAPGTSRRACGEVHWNTSAAARTKEQQLKCGEDVYFGVSIRPGGFPFGKTNVLSFYDCVTIVNLSPVAFYCGIKSGPLGSRRSLSVEPTPLHVAGTSSQRIACCTAQSVTISTMPEDEARKAQKEEDVDVPMMRFGSLLSTAKHHANKMTQMVRSPSEMATHAMSGTWTSMSDGSASMQVLMRQVNVALERPTAFLIRLLCTGGTPSAELSRYGGSASFLKSDSRMSANSSAKQAPLGASSSQEEIGQRQPSIKTLKSSSSVFPTVYQNFHVHIKKAHYGVATLLIVEPAEPGCAVLNETPWKLWIWQRGVYTDWELIHPGQRLPFAWYDPTGTLNLEASIAEQHDPAAEPDFNSMLGFNVKRLSSDSSVSSMSHADTRQSRQSSHPDALRMVKEFDNQRSQEVFRLMTAEQFSQEEKAACQLRSSWSALGTMTHTVDLIDLGIVDNFRLLVEGIGISLIDAAQLELVYVSVDRLSLAVVPWQQGPRSTTTNNPPVDILLTVLNIQIDSHIPGSFFPCALRAFEGRHQLWRALSLYSRQGERRGQHVEGGAALLRAPLVKVKLSRCRLLGGAGVVVKTVKASLDKVVVNADESFLVGLCAYYCRIALYFNLPPFDKHDSEATKLSGRGSTASRSADDNHVMTSPSAATRALAAPRSRPKAMESWLLKVEEVLEMDDATSYVSMRLSESRTPYLAKQESDQDVASLLDLLLPFYRLAALQPAMIWTKSRKLVQRRVDLSLRDLGALAKEHYFEPIVRRLALLLVFSLDWLGNPLHLLFGIMGGMRELVRQPWIHGCVGFPKGIAVCACSCGGAILDSVTRLMAASVKALNRFRRCLMSIFGVQMPKSTANFVTLEKMPTGVTDGFKHAILRTWHESQELQTTLQELVMAPLSPRAGGSRCQRLFGICVGLPLLGPTVLVVALLGFFEMVLIFLATVFQGIVSRLYQQSAEAVYDVDPLQLFALEIPIHVRPHRPPQIFSMGSSAYSYLPTLIAHQLLEAERLPLPERWRKLSKNRTAQAVLAKALREEDAAISATWCCGKKGTTGEGEAFIMAVIGGHAGLLRVHQWGNINKAGRPNRLRAKYRWLWQVPLHTVVSVNLEAVAVGKQGGGDTAVWKLELDLGAKQRQGRAFTRQSSLQSIQDKVAHTLQKEHCFYFENYARGARAYELLVRAFFVASAKESDIEPQQSPRSNMESQV
eukprot:TRINITY_DN20586_c0_g2_i1.p1 TRINITY_DN20586_c0_g2~~TRINITY_DN20586_c0_g2_i1.p1  ORF type:complete len:3426 (+),score=704.46 TRINITY_DN20586_c0_g2_i1:38-10315(+)